MNIDAKVSLNTVKEFSSVVSEIINFSSDKFNSGISNIEKNIVVLKTFRDSMNSKMAELNTSKFSLEEKISTLITDRNNTQLDLDDYYEELNGVNEDLSTWHKKSVYRGLKYKRHKLEENIASAKEQLDYIKKKYCKAKNLMTTLVEIISSIDNVADIIIRMTDNLEKMLIVLAEIKKKSINNSLYADEILKNIEKIIEYYQREKIVFDKISESDNYRLYSNCAENIINPISSNYKIGYSRYTDEQIKIHGIKFDKQNHVCEYDGNCYGGKYNSYEVRFDRTSKNDSILGFYQGERGESKYVPSTKSAEGIRIAKTLKEYNLDGIDYYNCEPNFEACSEAIVKIEEMTEHRLDYYLNGKKCLGNFSKADMKLAQIWNSEQHDGKTNWKPRDIYNYRHSKKLAWHEKCDTTTMVLVKRDINDYFRHSGGCSECKVRDSRMLQGEFDD